MLIKNSHVCTIHTYSAACVCIHQIDQLIYPEEVIQRHVMLQTLLTKGLHMTSDGQKIYFQDRMYLHTHNYSGARVRSM